MIAQVCPRLIAFMEVPTNSAELSSLEPCLNPTGGKDAPCHPVLSAFVIQDVSWAEFSQSQKAGAINDVLDGLEHFGEDLRVVIQP